MAKPKTIRALERGLEVMQFLQHKRAATLNDIYKSTGLPRPTLLRILRTLELGGLVRRGIGDGLYRNSFKLQRLAENLDESDRLAEIVAPTLDKMCQRVLWPSDLCVLREGAELYMEIKETSRPSSPFMVNRVSIGQQINLPLSAVGRAYLAFCSDDERERILTRLAESDDPTNQLVRNRDRFESTLEDVRRQGYALRDPIYVHGHRGVTPFGDGRLQAIAVPILSREAVCGAVTLVWLRSAMEIEEFVARHLPDLQDAARVINEELESIGFIPDPKAD